MYKIEIKPLNIFLDENQYCVLYGPVTKEALDDLQIGIAGFGNTITLAMNNFVENWSISSNDEKEKALSKHYFTNPEEPGAGFCIECGEYLTHKSHHAQSST